MMLRLPQLAAYVTATADMLRVQPCLRACARLKKRSPGLSGPRVIKDCWRLIDADFHDQTVSRMMHALYWRDRGIVDFTSWQEEHLLDKHGMACHFDHDFELWSEEKSQEISDVRLADDFLGVTDPELSIPECRHCFHYLPESALDAISAKLHSVLAIVCRQVTSNARSLTVCFTGSRQYSYDFS